VFYLLFLFLGRDAIFVIFTAIITMMTTIGTSIVIAIANQTFNQAKEFNQICVLSMVTSNGEPSSSLLLSLLMHAKRGNKCYEKHSCNNKGE
jgi:hypothetical protein